MLKKWNNKAFIRFFFVFLLAFLCLIFTILIFVAKLENEKLKEQRQEMIRESTENAIEYLDNLISNERGIAASLQNVSWVIKLSANTTVFDKQFTLNRVKEITSDFLFYIPSGSDIASRAVYFPLRNQVVRQRGINSGEYWFQNQGVPANETQAFLEKIRSVKEITCVLHLDDRGNTRFADKILLVSPINKSTSPSSYLCTMLSSQAIGKHIGQILPDYFSGFLVHDADGALIMDYWKKEETENDIVMPGLSISSQPWEITFVLNDSVKQNTGANWFMLLLLGFVGALASTILAATLATYTYYPLHKLSHRLSISHKTHNVYANISSSIDSMAQKIKESQRENHLRQLLSGAFDKDVSLPAIPFRENMWMQVFVLPTQASLPENLLEQPDGVAIEWVQSIDMDILIVGAEQPDDMASYRSILLKRLAGAGLGVFSGSVEKGLLGASISYQNALEKKQYISAGFLPAYQFPMDWENQLMISLRNGRQEMMREIFKVIINENKKTAKEDMMQLISILASDERRAVMELNLNVSTLSPLDSLYHCQTSQNYFDILIQTAENICQGVKERIGEADGLGKRIISYIDTNYADSGMSIIAIEDAFQLSANTINKNIKTATGMTFLPYITRVRMEKAKELLAGRGMKISDVAQMVGYENEYSFRRTFERYVGSKAQNWGITPSQNDRDDG